MNEDAGIKRVYTRALDPVHIGAGGYRLGRVDNTIVRDPATDVPKVPGTSIAGVVRAFYTVYLMENDNECKSKSNEEEKKKCAEEEAKLVFGDETKKGILRFYDGQIVFFPVSSIQGTVWITTKELIEYWFGEIKDKNGEKIKIPDEIGNEAHAIKGIDTDKPLNLGWLLLKVEKAENGKEVVLPSEIDKWVKRIVLVSEKLFSHIVNDNLEVRTSVKIDSDTGTAEAGKLFTYEAIPRGTVFGFEIGVDKHRDGSVDVNKIINAVSPYFKLLGIGGMGTRGFGRIELAIEQKVKSQGGETNAQS
ncbi:MAG: type III-B CRISPR module RAMP protein Cmr4 [Canidatus Methanoxibalbensis ujae]|nr:type III-B CRISPR module RAMP protein Cmr4 [Candidatus Methanoxibalbensis ujae]